VENIDHFKDEEIYKDFVRKKGNAAFPNDSLSFKKMLNWIEEYQEFMARFQTKEDYQNSMKIKGNKYGVYTQEVIDKTYELRKRQ
jgi:hypothetical protein